MAREKFRKYAWILNERIVRIAAVPEGEDPCAPTFAVRSLKGFKPAKPRRNGAWLALRTKYLTVRWREDGEPFDARNLKIEWGLGSEARTWKPGDIDEENLTGIALSHDGLRADFIPNRARPYDPMAGFESYGHSCHHPQGRLADMIVKLTGAKGWTPKIWEEVGRLWRDESPKLMKRWPATLLAERERVATIPPGLLSRSGLTIFRDDSVPWIEGENRPDGSTISRAQVLYAFAYGHDYKRGLRLLKRVLGAAPVAPDWMLGVWFSCYRVMGERHFRQLKKDFDRHDLPLDVVVVDTDWHRQWWSGFDWNRRLFPDPKRFAAWRAKEGLRTAFNVHPCLIPARDTRLDQYLRQAGVAKNIETESPDRFRRNCQFVDLFDSRQADAWFDVFHPPIEREGCDLWWVDGQLIHPQGNDAAAVMNELYHERTHVGKRGKAPILSRASGLGAHRSTALFTGDTHSQWEVLAEEVRSTHRAANKLWAYVSHDIGGFFRAPGQDWPNKPAVDLFVRWMQFGCFSPMMRFHSDHGIREPWRFGADALETARRFLWLRKCLLPYLRNLAQEAHESGVGLVRPMYYDFPEAEEAYEADGQYMLGDALLVAPVAQPDSIGRIWIPEGRWQHLFLPRIVEGSAWIEEEVPLAISPIYTRVGAIIPAFRRDDLRRKRAGKPREFLIGGGEPLAVRLGV